MVTPFHRSTTDIENASGTRGIDLTRGATATADNTAA